MINRIITVLAILSGLMASGNQLCSRFGENGCMFCVTGYYPDDSGDCLPVEKKIENCFFYDSATTCAYCDGFYNTDGKTCWKNPIPDCVFSNNSNDKCLACYGSLPDSNGRCEGKEQCELENCASCFNKQWCFYCYPGHALYKGKCVELENCYEASQTNQNLCAQCGPNFYNDEGVCRPLGKRQTVLEK